MKLGELIEKLQEIDKKYGDIPVKYVNQAGTFPLEAEVISIGVEETPERYVELGCYY